MSPFSRVIGRSTVAWLCSVEFLQFRVKIRFQFEFLARDKPDEESSLDLLATLCRGVNVVRQKRGEKEREKSRGG